MAKIKGCINKQCIANKKMIKFKKEDSYCSKCGQELFFVCAKCYMVLDDGDGKYCIRCTEERKDKRDDNIKKIGSFAVAVGTVFSIVLANTKDKGKKKK